jgi:hypothetical protein
MQSDVLAAELRRRRTTKAAGFRSKKVRGDLSLVPVVIAILAGLACAEPKREGDQSEPLQVSRRAASGKQAVARCYQSLHSVLLGPTTKSRQNGQGPGWLRIEGTPDADSGSGELVDANRAGLGALWRRGPVDSVSIAAADDFLRVELRLAVSDSIAIGSAIARSDADVEKDASGQLRTFRRGWILRAARAPCDSMPKRSTRRTS